MKKYNWLKLLIISIIIVLGLVTFFYIRSTSNTRFTVAETKWIQDNKTNVINITIPTNEPGFSYGGEGIFLDFIEYFEKNIELDFNEVTDNEESAYNFKLVPNEDVTSSDIVFFEENYTVIRKTAEKLTSLYSVKRLKLGVLSNNEKIMGTYLNTTNYQTFANYEELKNALENNQIDAIVAPKSIYLYEILGGDFNVSYYLNDIRCSYVLRLGTEENLNSIIQKEYNLWEEQAELYNKHLFDLYIEANNIDEITETNFKSKRYTYGYVDNSPYEQLDGYDISGMNSIYISEFSALTNSEFKYKKYDNIEELVDAFKSGQIDFMYLDFLYEGLEDKILLTSHVSDKYLVLKHKDSNYVIDSFNGLKSVDVYIREGSLVLKSLEEIATIKSYPTTLEAINEAVKEDGIIVIDKNTYDYYKNSYLKDYICIYETEESIPSSFAIYNSTQNSTFATLFEDYINLSNTKRININSYTPAKSEIEAKNYDLLTLMIFSIGGLLIVWIVIRIVTNLVNRKRRMNLIKKDEKMKFFDMMTSLKNRNYLNHNMEKWDENTIYPQTIIIVDLNNIKYINDTHGHEAGDKVIISAANILINTQLEKSEIIRTDGNEFLIYLIGYREKAVVNYIRRLYKEMKRLPYNYGSAIGYSTINDNIKTIDDAINEATIDMRKNKDEEKK